MKTIKNILLLKSIGASAFIILLFLGSNPLQAQHQHHSDNVQRTKNIYIAMMDTMMANMHNVPIGTTPEIVFLQQMIPHHEGALDMAKYEIAHGKNKNMIKLAESIVAEQKAEIKQMQCWLKEAKPAHGKLPEVFVSAMSNTMTTMMSNMPKESELNDTDRAFAAVMKPHHQAAIDMAKVIIQYSKNNRINNYAKQLISAQQEEVNTMSAFLSNKN